MRPIDIVGGGPAGSSAALTALSESCTVRLFEKSRLPRHKVCGEFLSPEIAVLLERLAVWDDFERLQPARIRRLAIYFGERRRTSKLPDCAYGLSRYEFDRLLFQKALARGAAVLHERYAPSHRETAAAVVIASGRSHRAEPGRRLFGFKAHFRGPTDDAVELFFFNGCYVGVSCVENSVTNVCGIAPEDVLKAHAFEMDELLLRSKPLAERVRPLTRAMEWLTTGPLVFSNHPQNQASAAQYPAGDALGFTDPFAGTGMLNAVATGSMAGLAAARGASSQRYLLECRRILGRAFRVNSMLRGLLAAGWAEHLAPLVPMPWLFRMTRLGHLPSHSLFVTLNSAMLSSHIE